MWRSQDPLCCHRSHPGYVKAAMPVKMLKPIATARASGTHSSGPQNCKVVALAISVIISQGATTQIAVPTHLFISKTPSIV